jgi:formiminoglutamase
MHQKAKPWTGRIDGENMEHLRWHQIVENDDQKFNEGTFFGIIGFAVDEGVKRNKGRTGAQEGPEKIRMFASNFPVISDLKMLDFGDIICTDDQLESAQNELSTLINQIQNQGGKSIVFGGGHELMYGHYAGLRKSFPNKKIGIINFDAHFDNRAVDPAIGATSGTGFWQIAQEDQNYSYLAIGIQENSNTKVLFDFADKNNTQYILGSDFCNENNEQINRQLNAFIEDVDLIYVSICLDVFAAAFAPGVSAVAYKGIFPDTFFFKILKQILSSKKIFALDVAELNPAFDVDNRTARLAAALVFEFIQHSSF